MRRLAAASLIAVFVAAMASCGGNGGKETENMPGRQVFEKQNCAQCHGSSGEGKPTAPQLRDLDSDWTKEQLVEYLRNPAQYAETDERLKKQAEQYPTMMPNYNYISDDDLAKLAEYLLAL